MFENLRAAINAALDAATPDSDPRDAISKMREAVVEARTSIELMREGVTKTEARLAAERQKLADAERRGRLAAGIQDTDTVEVAEKFAAKHGERVKVLEGKLEAQQAELMLAEQGIRGDEIAAGRAAAQAARDGGFPQGRGRVARPGSRRHITFRDR